MREKIECGRVEPLQIVEKQGKRMFRPCEYADEPPKHQLEAPLRLLWRELRNRGLFSHHEPQFGGQVDDEPAVPAQRLPQRVGPPRPLNPPLAAHKPRLVLKNLPPRRLAGLPV